MSETLSWKEHRVLQGDGRGGYNSHPAQLRFVPQSQNQMVWIFGLAKMDNGEIARVGVRRPAQGPPWIEQTLIAFSPDDGATWSEYIEIPNCTGRPMMLAYLGKGELAFNAGWEEKSYRFFSHDYGRTWPERVPFQPASDGKEVSVEGNTLVEQDEKTKIVWVGETGQTFPNGHWPNAVRGQFRWSYDGGRTWEKEVLPPEWYWEDTWQGKKYTRGVGEGGLVRAANGWLVAGLRTDMPVKYFDLPFQNDNLEGTAVSISKDNGKTWSPLQHIFEAGRHHANLLRMPDGRLVMTVICRVDIRNGQLASYRRGCDAIVSYDNGLSWDTGRRYILDDFAYLPGEDWVTNICGHLYSIPLDDGSILTGYGNYLAGGILIRWKPE
jgi:hypothetical protein